MKRTLSLLSLAGVAGYLYYKLSQSTNRKTETEPQEAIEVTIDDSDTDTTENSAEQEDSSEEDYECQAEGCQRSFDTERGRNIHYGQVHKSSEDD